MQDTLLTRRALLKNSMFGAACLSLGGLSLSGCTAGPTTGQSYLPNYTEPENRNTITFWTDIMVQAVRNKKFNPPRASRIFAMGHLAGFLAINGIQKHYTSPFGYNDGPDGANIDVAYATAMSIAISDGFQSLFTVDLQRFLNKFPNDQAKADGIKWGRTVGKAIVKMRTNDGAQDFMAENYHGNYPRRGDILQWTTTGPFYRAEFGPAFQTYSRPLLPGWGQLKPWFMPNLTQFRAIDFPEATSDQFANEYLEVKELGAYDSKTRTEDQTEIAFFWQDGGGGAGVPGHWQLIAMKLWQDMDMPMIEQAKAFALLSMGQSDAAISTWDTKYHYDIVRPETSIRIRADQFGNDKIAGTRDPNWQSLIPTPNFPAYTSGHSTFSGVSARMIALVLGRDKITFSAGAPDQRLWHRYLSKSYRTWNSVWQAAEENGMSRIYGGVHWSADNVEGLRVGKDLADYAFKNVFAKKV